MTRTEELELKVARLEALLKVYNSAIRDLLSKDVRSAHFEANAILGETNGVDGITGDESINEKDRDMVRRMIPLVCSEFGVRLSALISRNRNRVIAVPRHVVIYLARKKTGLSFPQLGRLFGRDHGTALNSVRKVKDTMDVNVEFRKRIEKLEAMLR